MPTLAFLNNGICSIINNNIFNTVFTARLVKISYLVTLV